MEYLREGNLHENLKRKSTGRQRLPATALWLAAVCASSLRPQSADRPEQPKVIVDPDGTVHVPAQAVRMSGFLSPEAKAYVTQHLEDMQNPQMLKQEEGIPKFMKGYVDRLHVLYPVDAQDTKIAGVHAVVYTPKPAVSDRNKERILIELHGGGFSGCWTACSQLESIPVASIGQIKVVALDYREGPENKFPAASEDVASVYKDILKTYRPENVGIYGCSAGGMLTAMSMAWFQKHDVPRPGAIGIFCAGAGRLWGWG